MLSKLAEILAPITDVLTLIFLAIVNEFSNKYKRNTVVYTKILTLHILIFTFYRFVLWENMACRSTRKINVTDLFLIRKQHNGATRITHVLTVDYMKIPLENLVRQKRKGLEKDDE